MTASIYRLWPLWLLLALLGVGGCKTKSKPASDLQRFIPAEARFLAKVDAARLRQTRMKDRILKLIDGSASMKQKWEKFTTQTGFNPLRDLEVMLLGLPYQKDEEKGDVGAVLIGRFDQAKVVTWFKEIGGDKVTTHQHGKHTYYHNTENRYCVAFVDAKTFVLASPGWITLMLDLADGKGQHVGSKADMRQLWSTVRPGQVLSVVAQVPGDVRAKAKETGSVMAAVESFVAMIDFAAGLELDLRANTPSEDDAKKLTEKFNSTVKELRTSPMVQRLGLAEMLNNANGFAKGKVFFARNNLTQQQVDTLIKQLGGAFKDKLAEMPQLSLPAPGAGAPAAANAPTSAPAKGVDAPPAGKTGSLPSFQLTPPGESRQKKPSRPGLLTP